MTLEADARVQAERRYGSPQFRRAFVRGALARRAGRPIESCPYKRRARGQTSWGRTWRAIWIHGWLWAQDYD